MPVLGPQVDPHRLAGGNALVGEQQLDAAGPVASTAERCRFHYVDLAEEVRNEWRLRPLVNVRWRPDLLDRALVHHDDAIRHRQRFFLVVRDHDRRDAEALLQIAHFAAQPLADLGIERGKRLIEQQQVRGSGERAGEGDALLLAAGELARKLAALVRKADQRQQFIDARLDLFPGVAAIDQAVRDVVVDRQIRKQRI